jgi:hypothetical protein
MKRASLLSVLLLFALPVTAPAAEQGLYASIKLGSTDVEASIGDNLDQVLDGDEDSKAYEVGFRFTRFFAIQAGYHDLGNIPGFGSPCPDGEICPAVVVPIEADTKAYSLAAVPQLPLGRRLSVFGKIGLVAWEADVEAVEGFEDVVEDFDDEEIIYGVGVRLALLGPLEIFGEWESIGSDIETVSFGLTFQF